MQTLLDRFLGNALHRNLGWMAIAEGMGRISRLVTVVVLARALTPHDYGVAAVALTTHELMRVLTRNGIGARLIQCAPEQLSQFCDTAYRLNWIMAVVLFTAQVGLAHPIAGFFGEPDLALMIVALAFIYLLYPLAFVQVFLVQRENRLKVTGLTSGTQTAVDNLLSVVFAVGGLGAWAVVLPKLLVAPIWVIAHRRCQNWRPTRGAALGPWQTFLQFGGNILGTEILRTARGQLDKIIIGRVLGLEALGLYYFAYNAGLGISSSLITAFNTAVFPYLCEGGSGALGKRYGDAVGAIAATMLPLVLLQAALAPWYVPIVFGEQWVAAIPVLVVLCLSALSRPFAEAASQLLRAVDRTGVDLRWNTAFSLLYLSAVLAGLPWGLFGVAVAITSVHLILEPIYAAWVRLRHLTIAPDQVSLERGLS